MRFKEHSIVTVIFIRVLLTNVQMRLEEHSVITVILLTSIQMRL